MRALRFHGPGDLRLEYDIAEPVCASNQIKIKPGYVGICGTDLHEYSSPTFIPEQGHPHPVTGETRPVTIGHEVAGTVVEVGSKIFDTDLKVGDKVAIQGTVCCFECSYCKEGHYNCCSKSGFLGLSGGGGGLSDFICVNSLFVHKLPDDVGLDVGGESMSSLRCRC
jgi:threonine dehydrogenase-like Zn-dependent dehydrogenase